MKVIIICMFSYVHFIYVYQKELTKIDKACIRLNKEVIYKKEVNIRVRNTTVVFRWIKIKFAEEFERGIMADLEGRVDYACQPCSSDNQKLEAVGYCTVCCELLCDSCYKTHSKLTATKHHRMLDRSAMKKSQLRAPCTDVLTETCPKHAGKTLEYFCKQHNSLCCSVCLTLKHSACSNKSYVPDISDGIGNSPEYNQLLEKIDKMVAIGTMHQARAEECKTYSDQLQTKVITNIRNFRKQVNDLLDQLEKDTMKKFSGLHAENSEKISRMSEKFENILSDIKCLKSELVTNEKEGNKNQLFVSLKLSHDRLDAFDNAMTEAQNETIARYSFQQSPQHMESTLSALWSQSVKQGDTPTQARLVQEVGVKSEDDTEECNLSGIVMVDRDRVLVADCDNKVVKLIHINTDNTGTSVTRLPLSSKPFDVTGLGNNQYAVALGREKKIEIVSVSDTGTLYSCRTLVTPGAAVTGLCFDGTNLIAACCLPGSVKVIAMSGAVLHTYTTDTYGRQLFSTPRGIAIDRATNTIYISDMEANTVTTMTTGGDVISVYTHDKLKFPAGIVVGRDGSVYVSSSDTHTIHQLGPTGRHTRVILGSDQGLANYPHAMAYGDEADMLVVSSGSSAPEKCGSIWLYHLE